MTRSVAATVQSSLLRRIVYDYSNRSLYVELRQQGGKYAVYEYQVSPSIAEGLLDPACPSHGQYFNRHIRNLADIPIDQEEFDRIFQRAKQDELPVIDWIRAFPKYAGLVYRELA